jgi:hypothetical protein
MDRWGVSGDDDWGRIVRQQIANMQDVDALLIVGALQALQGDEKWAKLLLERGCGKVTDKIIGDEDQPIAHTFTLKTWIC